MLLIDGVLDEELLNLVASHPLEGETVYLYSTGGKSYIMMAILDMLNNGNIKELVLAGEAMSAAFTLFVLFKGNKRILPHSVGMMHVGRIELDMTIYGKPLPRYSEEIGIHSKQCIEFEEKFLELSDMPDSIRKKFKAGHDIFMSARDLKEFITKNPFSKYEVLFEV